MGILVHLQQSCPRHCAGPMFTDRKLKVMDGWKSRTSSGHAASPSAQPLPRLEQQATLDKSQLWLLGIVLQIWARKALA